MLLVSMRLDTDYASMQNSSTGEQGFRKTFLADIAPVLKIAPSRVKILSTKPGSVIVDFMIAEGERSVLTLSRYFQETLPARLESDFKKGIVTRTYVPPACTIYYI